jgi:hypothetical protein
MSCPLCGWEKMNSIFLKKNAHLISDVWAPVLAAFLSHLLVEDST